MLTNKLTSSSTFLFPLEKRKQHTKSIIEKTKNFLYNFTHNDTISGFILVLFHWIIICIPLLYLIIGEINKLYYICCFIWIAIFSLHYYFKGCILTRIERSLWQTKDWWGPWVVLFTPLENTGIEITSQLSENIFICWAILLITISFLRILFEL